MPKSIVCDREVHKYLLEQGTNFNFSSAYHPQTDGQTEVVNRTIEMYFRCFTSNKPRNWARWMIWVEYYYNTSVHTSTKKTHYEIVLWSASTHVIILFQVQLKLSCFEVGDLVYLRLQPYRQMSVSLRKNLKLSARYCGPYEIIQRVGPVAYKLQVLSESRIYLVFHISCLKEKVGTSIQVHHELLNLQEEEDVIIAQPQAVLERRT
ncbi:hypothetical protein AMTRI_Chr11g99680 [Amborella trichopoda]